MKLRKSCNCRAGELNEDSWKDFLFFELQQTNKLGKDRAVVKYNQEITTLALPLAQSLELQIYALISVGIKRVSDIEIYEKPF